MSMEIETSIQKLVFHSVSIETECIPKATYPLVLKEMEHIQKVWFSIVSKEKYEGYKNGFIK